MTLAIQLNKGIVSITPYSHPLVSCLELSWMPPLTRLKCLSEHGIILQGELYYHKPGPLGAAKEGTYWYHGLSGGFRRLSQPFLPQTWKKGPGDHTAWSRRWRKKSYALPGAVRVNRYYLSLIAVDMSNKAWFARYQEGAWFPLNPLALFSIPLLEISSCGFLFWGP